MLEYKTEFNIFTPLFLKYDENVYRPTLLNDLKINLSKELLSLFNEDFYFYLKINSLFSADNYGNTIKGLIYPIVNNNIFW